MTKILNLDKLESSSDKSLTLNGKTHPFVPYSVGQFIDQLKNMEKYQGASDIPVSEYLEQMIGMVKGAFPSIPDEDLRSLSIDRIRLISEFIRGDLQDQAIKGVEQDEGSDAAKKIEGKFEVTSIDFPYYVARVSRFYSMSYYEVLGMPLRSFWSFNANIRRLRAEENLSVLDLHLAGAFGTDAKAIETLRRSYAETMEEPMKGFATGHVDAEEHKKGVQRLKELAAAMKRKPTNEHSQPQS